MSLKWYAARTVPRAEYLAASELRNDGFEIFLPLIKSNHPRNGRADMPLFPGYLFLRCKFGSEEMPSFREAPHVVGWLSFGGVVPSVPDKVLDSLTNRGEAINNLGRHFRPGDKVFLASNTVQSLAEVVDESKGPEGRVRVLLQFMGRLVSAQVNWQDLQPAERQPSAQSRVPRRTRGRGRWIRGVAPTAVVGD